jgi:hypothetical protein
MRLGAPAVRLQKYLIRRIGEGLFGSVWGFKNPAESPNFRISAWEFHAFPDRPI